MSEATLHEAEIMQARERLARVLGRLVSVVHGLEDQIEMLVRNREDVMLRLRENEALLENERAITSQRDSLGESTKAEIQQAQDALDKANAVVAERDQLISSLHRTVEAQIIELGNREDLATQLAERLEQAAAQNAEMKAENDQIAEQLTATVSECDRMATEILEVRNTVDIYTLKFTADERLQLIKTVDTLIDRVDELTQHNGRS